MSNNYGNIIVYPVGEILLTWKILYTEGSK